MAEWHPTKNVNIDPKQISVYSHRNIWWKCSFCSHEWIAKPGCRSIGVGKGCRKCNLFGGGIAKGAQKVEEALQELKEGCVPGFTLDFKSEQQLPGMVHKRPLWLDFYIESNSLKRRAVIEYDGHLHFRRKDNDEKEWLETVRRDLAKNKYLVKNKIHVLRISYQYPKQKIRSLIHNFLGDALFHEQISEESYLKCSCPEIYKKLRDESLSLITKKVI